MAPRTKQWHIKHRLDIVYQHASVMSTDPQQQNYVCRSDITGLAHTRTHTHTHPFNGPLSGTTQVGRYQKGKTNLDFTEARDSE